MSARKFFKFTETAQVASVVGKIWALRPELRGKKSLTALLAFGALLRELECVAKAYNGAQISVSGTDAGVAQSSEDGTNTDDEWD